eukprot:350140-Chlamydomonas_euryale.AAC.2
MHAQLASASPWGSQQRPAGWLGGRAPSPFSKTLKGVGVHLWRVSRPPVEPGRPADRPTDRPTDRPGRPAGGNPPAPPEGPRHGRRRGALHPSRIRPAAPTDKPLPTHFASTPVGLRHSGRSVLLFCRKLTRPPTAVSLRGGDRLQPAIAAAAVQSTQQSSQRRCELPPSTRRAAPRRAGRSRDNSQCALLNFLCAAR